MVLAGGAGQGFPAKPVFADLFLSRCCGGWFLLVWGWGLLGVWSLLVVVGRHRFERVPAFRVRWVCVGCWWVECHEFRWWVVVSACWRVSWSEG